MNDPLQSDAIRSRKPEPSPAPAWYADARKFRDSGMSVRAIARIVGRNESVVRQYLDENGEKERKRERVRRANKSAFEIGHRGATEEVKLFSGREPRRILADAETKREAVALFAASKIDRAALMMRITVGRPDTSAALAQRAGSR